MKSILKLFSCSIVLVAILVIFGVWTVKSGCVNYLLLDEQQRHEELLDELRRHEELLTILIKPTGKEHFLSRLDDLGIRYFITKEESKDVVLFKDGFAEIENGEITSWSYYNSNVRIPAIPEEIVEKLRNSQTTSAEVIKRFGLPSSMYCEKDGNFSFSYFFIRDERTKRSDGKYNSELIFWFNNDCKLNNCSYSIIDDLNQKTLEELI